MKKVKLVSIVLACLMALVFVSCQDSVSNASDDNFNLADLAGTWVGTFHGVNATVTIIDTWWSMTVPGFFTDNGTLSMMADGRTAIFHSANLGGVETGIGTLIDRNTARIILNYRADFPGTYTFTRQ